MIPYSKQTISKEDIEAVLKVLRSPILTRGPLVRQFEELIAKKVGAKYAVAFSSATAGLHGSYFAIGVQAGDEVITTPLTFAATANTALWQGATVVFADIDPMTGNLDPQEVEKKITQRTKAITAVDYGGKPANLAALKKIAKKYRLFLLEDAAHALGAVYGGKRIGAISDLTVFSFHPVKPITAGEAGVVTTNDKKLYARLLLFRNHGMTRDRTQWRDKNAPDYHYEMHELGLNYWLTDMQAALGISQLKRLDKFMAQRQRAAKNYLRLLAKTNLILPTAGAVGESAWHLFPIRLPQQLKGMRDVLYTELKRKGIGAQVHYIPVYWHPFYQRLGYTKGLCPKAEEFFKSVLSIPLFPGITPREQQLVADAINTSLTTHEKGR